MITAVVNLIKSTRTRGPVEAEHVVVLCQESRVRDLAATWLSQADLDVDVAKTGPEAYRCLAGHPHERQTLITDRVFPPWPGLVSIPQLKQEVPGLRVIVVQDGAEDAVTVAQSAGADAGIQRPLNRKDLFLLLEVNAEAEAAKTKGAA